MEHANADNNISFHLLNSAGPGNYLVPAFVCQVSGISIIRTLDPEDEHQVSMARIFQAAGLTTIEGLLKFKMIQQIDYHAQLGFAGPNLLEIWATASRARTIVAALWHAPPDALSNLLAPALDCCFTLYDQTRNSLLHNWHLRTVSPSAYSTALILSSIFSIHDVEWLQDKSAWIRTGIPNKTNIRAAQDSLDIAIIGWSVDAAERYFARDEKLDIQDRWTPVITILQESMRIDAYGAVPVLATGHNRTNSPEVDVLALCERIARRHGSRKAASRRPLAVKSSLHNMATQTIAQQSRDADTKSDKACQTEPTAKIEESDHNSRLIIILMSFGAMLSFILYKLYGYT